MSCGVPMPKAAKKLSPRKLQFRELLGESGLEQKEFARLYGTTPETVSRWKADPLQRDGALEPPKSALVILFSFTKMNMTEKTSLLAATEAWK